MKKAKLFNGEKVMLGDSVSFIYSDGNIQTGTIRLRSNRSLYFWNTKFNITDYRSAFKNN